MLPGVYIATKKNGTLYYRSNITFSNKHISLGSYSTEHLAHQAYQEAGSLLYDLSVSLEDSFLFSTILPFDKVISLLNFRDNHIYFKTPIYLKNNFFLYYVSKQDELKFDIDDLFYYSSHKIMRRLGHLFVSDYGMQVNILSRYGIKNYAVMGRDYCFVNEDTTDYRYSNIIIINPYHGVTKSSLKGIVSYQAKIHINGTFIVGTYPTVEIAAIAYNKAADLAKNNGISKNFQTNYIDNYSPREYAEIYSTVKISKKYTNYLASFPHFPTKNKDEVCTAT
ncbi:MAG: hypothetical protein RR139_03525 [Lachnospiraceae bacterium]